MSELSDRTTVFLSAKKVDHSWCHRFRFKIINVRQKDFLERRLEGFFIGKQEFSLEIPLRVDKSEVSIAFRNDCYDVELGYDGNLIIYHVDVYGTIIWDKSASTLEDMYGSQCRFRIKDYARCKSPKVVLLLLKKRMGKIMFVFSVLLLACSGEQKEQTKEERERALQERTKKLGERWKAHKKKEAQALQEQTEPAEKASPPEDEGNSSKSTWEKARDMKASVAQKASELREKTEPTLLVVESLHLALDIEAETLRQDFEKAQLNIVEVGHHLECSLIATDGELQHLPNQKYEIKWWINGKEVEKKASQYCSGATLGIGLNSGGPSCPQHIKGAFYPYMANMQRNDDDRFQCGLSFTFSMNAKIQKYLADNPFPKLKSDSVQWSRWPELKKQRGGANSFEGTELDCEPHDFKKGLCP